MLVKDYLGYWVNVEQPRWGIEAHPVGTARPSHADALARTAKAATALSQQEAVNWYADLGGLSPIAATPEGEAIRGLVARRGVPAEAPSSERLIPAGEAVRRAVAAIRERHRRPPNDAEVAALLAWEGRDGIPADELAALIEAPPATSAAGGLA
jgi:hypothetical protein